MSEIFQVSRSGYYRWLGHTPSKRAIQNQRLRKAIRRVWEGSRKKYGSPRIYRQLKTEGWQVSRQRIARLMVVMGIASQIRRKWVKTTDSNHRWPVAANLLERKFSPDKLGRAWVSDITFIPSEQGWLYLTIVMDLADRYESYQQARKAIFEFIEIWYNRHRLHSALDYQTPVQTEQNLKHKPAA